MAPQVTAIPATLNKFSSTPLQPTAKRKVAGYARVSTDNIDQQTSYEAQLDYYTKYIRSRSDWEFAGMYSDEGISGTKTAHRDGFNRMIKDALDGKIDLIITKSISRFARNTVDSLTTIRNLKEKGVEVYFEKENIYTLDSKGELLITIMSSLAQEESRSISENITWGRRKQMADGKVSFSYSRFLGLDKDPETGKIVINEEEAEIVRMIYRLFLDGLTPYAISKELTKRGIKTPSGMDIWPQSTVKSILKNEKYKGDALLQKEYTVDFLQGKKKKNNGELPQYYVKGNHEAIIDPDTFDLVQAEMARRLTEKSRYCSVDVFSLKIKCGDCGAHCGPHIEHSNDKYRRVIYRCCRKYKGDNICRSSHGTESQIKKAFLSALNKIILDKKEIFHNIKTIQKTICNTDKLEKEKATIQEEMDRLVIMSQNLIAENAALPYDQETYQTKYDSLMERYEKAKIRFGEISVEINSRKMQEASIDKFIRTLKRHDCQITEYDFELWNSLLEKAILERDRRITFVFFDGTSITEEIPYEKRKLT